MRIVLLFTLVLSTSIYAQDYLEDTIDQDKYKSLLKNCSNEIGQLESNNSDIANLYKTLLKIQSSKNCASIASFSPEELGRTRGGAPCSINPKNELTGISYGKIAIQMTDGSSSSLDWDTGHIAKMDIKNYLYKGTQFAQPMVKQLKEKNICKNLKDKPYTGELTPKSCKNKVEVLDYGINPSNDIANLKIGYKSKSGKRCTKTIEDDDGVISLSLVMLQVKQRLKKDTSKKMFRFNGKEIYQIKKAIERNSKYAKQSKKGLDELKAKDYLTEDEEYTLVNHETMIRQNKQFKNMFSGIMGGALQEYSKDEIQKILYETGQTTVANDEISEDGTLEASVEHGYTNKTQCGSSKNEDWNSIDDILLKLHKSNVDLWTMNKPRNEGHGCALIVETNSDDSQRSKDSSQSRQSSQKE